MRVRGNPRNGETAMFPRAVWTRARCPVASGVSGVSAMDKTSRFRGYSACIPYIGEDKSRLGSGVVWPTKKGSAKALKH